MNATMRFIVWGTIPVGATIGGVIATAVGVTQAIWVGSILSCTAVLPVLLGPVRRLRDFPTPSEPNDALAQAVTSGYEPMGIAAPRSLEGIGEWSGEEGGDPNREGRERQRGSHGQDGGSE